MEYRLDETDRQLLRLLQTNARASTAHLARQMNLARTTVVARIARLEQEGVIAGYGVRLGDRKSTRLNSSHTVISYAVFCLKKKKRKNKFRQSTCSLQSNKL